MTTDITTRTYAVPTRHGGTAERSVFCHLRSAGVTLQSSGMHTTSAGSDPDTGKPECHVTVRGTSAVHGAMLDRFPWMGW